MKSLFKKKTKRSGSSLVVQWLRFSAFIAMAWVHPLGPTSYLKDLFPTSQLITGRPRQNPRLLMPNPVTSYGLVNSAYNWALITDTYIFHFLLSFGVKG